MEPDGSTLLVHSAWRSSASELPIVPTKVSTAGSSTSSGQSRRPSHHSANGSASVNGHDTTESNESNETPRSRLPQPRTNGYRPPKYEMTPCTGPSPCHEPALIVNETPRWYSMSPPIAFE